MQRDDEDDVWRSIVENYGDRPTLDDEPPAPAPAPTAPATPPTYDVPLPEEPESDLARADEERFVPPEPPPLPRPVGARLAAWTGVFGAPAVLLLFLVLGIGLPQVVSYALVAGFVGGFLYLVWQMPRGPRDPWDDGAQL
ncbi:MULTISPECIES: hypothetical protein [unclassified Nocardioides]|uniref:hypothetical protein n=1 Tax=unclassified Nocardioides TaxID=2615069 RepID=UPI00266658C6|nr:hypothetical protein [Nocardioides sp. Arc9.136]WKN50038.1 hypothetical protein OSR43_07915 [Nocardioides sp. Arc9.136]